MDNLYLVASIAIMAVATVATRALPFLLFRDRKAPAFVPFLADYAPPAILTILTLYCLKDVNWTSAPHGVRELAAIGLTALLHLWKHSTLLSIVGGTALYMILIRSF